MAAALHIEQYGRELINKLIPGVASHCWMPQDDDGYALSLHGGYWRIVVYPKSIHIKNAAGVTIYSHLPAITSNNRTDLKRLWELVSIKVDADIENDLGNIVKFHL